MTYPVNGVFNTRDITQTNSTISCDLPTNASLNEDSLNCISNVTQLNITTSSQLSSSSSMKFC
jgi:hypothetical protein